MPLPNSYFDPEKAFSMGLGILKLTEKTAVSGFAAATTGVITKADHELKNGMALSVTVATGGSGLTVGTIYYVISVDDNSFKLSATYGGAALTFETAYSAISFIPVHMFETDKITPKSEQEKKEQKHPDSKGILRVVNQRVKSESESFEIEIKDTKRLPEIFDGALNGTKSCSAQMWLPDPQADEEGSCAWVSEEFDSEVTRTGDLSWSTNDDFDKGTLVVTSMKPGAIKWDTDVEV